MEADWEVDVGGEAPVIDAHWAGWIDLSASSESAAQLPEASLLPGLADTLVRLNAASSPVWTAKCDVWPQDEFDLDELGADREHAAVAMACYIDLLPRAADVWTGVEQTADWCRNVCRLLHALPQFQCRIDLIVRAALLRGKDSALGVTAYLIGCGRTQPEALAFLAAGLGILGDVLTGRTPPPTQHSQIQ